MKRFLLTVLVSSVLFFVGCQTEEEIYLPDCTEKAVVSSSAVTDTTEKFVRYPLSAFPSEKIVYPACMELVLKKEDVRRILSEGKIGDVPVCIAETVSSVLYAAYPTDTGYTAFYTIHENTEAYAFMDSVRLEPFENIFGRSGLQLMFGVGANYESHIYFLWEDARPEMFFEASHRDVFTGDMFVQYYGSMGVGALCRIEEDGMYRYDLTRKLESIFPPDKYHIPFMPAFEQGREIYGHRGIFSFRVENRETGETLSFVGWLDGGDFCLRQEKNM